MFLHEGIRENLRFLTLEVRKQLVKCSAFFLRPDRALLASVLSKDDYIDNLKTLIQRKCFEQAALAHGKDESQVELLKAIDVIAVNLERIADFCENVMDQAGYITDESILIGRNFSAYFEEIVGGLDLVEEALFKSQVQTALEICRAENTIDDLYQYDFSLILDELKSSDDVQGLVTILFIFRYLERMGDALLNVGEAILSAILGERIKIDQFRALEESLESSDLNQSITDVDLGALKETKSGNRINPIRGKGSGDRDRLVIFKHGQIGKLTDERKNIERWQGIMPTLVPRIFAFHEHGENGSILLEYLRGRNFEEILLGGDGGEVDEALEAVMGTLNEVWNETREPEPANARYMEQLARRAPEVYAVHPGFREQGGEIGGVAVTSFDEVVKRAHALEKTLPSPFSVFIHGDFNIDNIIYSEREHRVHFIDLHRSRMMDYVQDVSVFLVSNHRLQAFQAPVRRLINRVVLRFHRFGVEYARSNGDKTFSARLALGLARSFATSTRFVLDKEFAKSMFLRARFLLEQLASREEQDPTKFEIPEEVLVD